MANEERLSRVATMNRLYQMQRELKDVKIKNDFNKAKAFGFHCRYIINHTEDWQISRNMIMYYPPHGFKGRNFIQVAENYLNIIISEAERKNPRNES